MRQQIHTTHQTLEAYTLPYPGEVSYGVCVHVERPQRVSVLEYLPGQFAQVQVRAVPVVDDLRLSTKQTKQLLAHGGCMAEGNDIFKLRTFHLEKQLYVQCRVRIE